MREMKAWPAVEGSAMTMGGIRAKEKRTFRIKALYVLCVRRWDMR
jgi:hypothetical protein